MRSTVFAMALLVTLAAAMTGCWSSSSSAPCQSNENYCDGDTAHTCSTTEEEGSRSTTKCDPNTQACSAGSCYTLTDVPCDPAGGSCDPSGHRAYNFCLKGRYASVIDCKEGELCTLGFDPGVGNYAGCALTPFEPCTQTGSFCRQNRVLFCDQKLGFFSLEADCNPNWTCSAYSATHASCITN
jgi:hypothetical protein